MQTGVFGCHSLDVQYDWHQNRVFRVGAGEGTLTEYPSHERSHPNAASRNWIQIEQILARSEPVHPGDPVHEQLCFQMGADDITIPASVRIHPALPYVQHGECLGYSPAMVVPIVSTEGQIIGIHCTYMDQNGTFLAQNSLLRTDGPGATKGSYVRLQDDIDDVLVIGSNVACCVAAKHSLKAAAVCIDKAALLQYYNLPKSVTRVILITPPDSNWVKSAHAFARKSQVRGVSTCVLTASAYINTWSDLYVMDQPQAASPGVAV